MGFLHDTDTWYKIRHSGWQKNAAASKTKRFPPAKRDFPLFWMSQCVACHPAGEILYHLTASCKAPVYAHQFLGERKCRRRVFPLLLRVLPNFHECFSIETRRKCFLFLLERPKENNEKRRTLESFICHQNVHSLHRTICIGNCMEPSNKGLIPRVFSEVAEITRVAQLNP